MAAQTDKFERHNVRTNTQEFDYEDILELELQKLEKMNFEIVAYMQHTHTDNNGNCQKVSDMSPNFIVLLKKDQMYYVTHGVFIDSRKSRCGWDPLSINNLRIIDHPINCETNDINTAIKIYGDKMLALNLNQDYNVLFLDKDETYAGIENDVTICDNERICCYYDTHTSNRYFYVSKNVFKKVAEYHLATYGCE